MLSAAADIIQIMNDIVLIIKRKKKTTNYALPSDTLIIRNEIINTSPDKQVRGSPLWNQPMKETEWAYTQN